MTLTERGIQLSIHRERLASSRIVCPNYTPRDWWECDIWQVTNAGYATEYEIKLALADFKADAKKSQRQYDKSGTRWKAYAEQKHDLLASACERGPSRFFYCVPKSIIEDVEPILPAWAGLIECRPMKGWHMAHLWVIKSAPRIHGCKVDEEEIDLCKARIVYRYWKAINDLHKIKAKDDGP